MFLWIGCGLPGEFEADIRRCCLEANREVGADTTAFSLPQHISLKISFDAGSRAEEIIPYLTALLAGQLPFTVHPAAIRQNGNILWVTFQENAALSRLHDMLDLGLGAEFDIPQHPYDRDFQFHSTLFMDDPGKIASLYSRLSAYPLPQALEVNSFLLGLSETGAPGSYRVVRHIHL